VITNLTAAEAATLVKAHVCGDCGGDLVNPWGGSYGVNGPIVRCLKDLGHSSLKVKDTRTRQLYNGKTKTWEDFDMQTQKPAQTQEIVRYQTDHGQLELSVRQIQQYICPKATQEEAYIFLRLCQAQRLNPFLKEAYLIVYGSGDNRKVSMIVGRDAFIRRAEAHEQFAGFRAGIIVELAEGNVEEIDGAFPPSGSKLLGGWTLVSRKDRDTPHKSTISFEEYDTGQANWKKMPATMCRKVALVQGLREVFPTVYAGIDVNVDVGDAEEIVGEVISDTAAPNQPSQPAPAGRPAPAQGAAAQTASAGTPAPATAASAAPGRTPATAAADVTVPTPADLPPSQADDLAALQADVQAAGLTWENFQRDVLKWVWAEWLARKGTVVGAQIRLKAYVAKQGGG
jgi:phage recombination protein Bet